MSRKLGALTLVLGILVCSMGLKTALSSNHSSGAVIGGERTGSSSTQPPPKPGSRTVTWSFRSSFSATRRSQVKETNAWFRSFIHLVLGNGLELAFVVCSIARKSFFRYFFLNLYFLLTIGSSVARHFILSRFGAGLRRISLRLFLHRRAAHPGAVCGVDQPVCARFR